MPNYGASLFCESLRIEIAANSNQRISTIDGSKENDIAALGIDQSLSKKNEKLFAYLPSVFIQNDQVGWVALGAINASAMVDDNFWLFEC